MRKIISLAYIVASCMMLCLSFTGLSQANILAESTFGADDEGWRVGEFFLTSSTSLPSYINPGEYIQTADLYSTNAYIAPPKFLGNQSAALGGDLRFDTQVASLDGIPYYAVILEGGGQQLGYLNGVPLSNLWKTFTIPFSVAGGGWYKGFSINGIGGIPATAFDLQTVLTSLTALRIQADWNLGPDRVDLDNVRLSSSNAVPEPATMLLLSCGLAGLFGIRRKFRK